MQVQPDDVADLALEFGSVENVKVSARQGCTPKRCQIRATVACEIGVPSPASAAASSREDQWVTPNCTGGSVSRRAPSGTTTPSPGSACRSDTG